MNNLFLSILVGAVLLAGCVNTQNPQFQGDLLKAPGSTQPAEPMLPSITPTPSPAGAPAAQTQKPSLDSSLDWFNSLMNRPSQTPVDCQIVLTSPDQSPLAFRIRRWGSNVRMDFGQAPTPVIVRGEEGYFPPITTLSETNSCDWIHLPSYLLNETLPVPQALNQNNTSTMPPKIHCTPGSQFGMEVFETPGKVCEIYQA